MSFDPRTFQANVRANSENIRRYVEDLKEWEENIAEKDYQLNEGQLQLTKRSEAPQQRDLQEAVFTYDLDEETKRIFLEQKGKGNEFFKKGEHEKALECYTVCTERCPQNPFGFSNRASALFQLGRVEEAEEDICIAIDLDKKNPKSLLKRANMRKKLSRFEDAIDDVTRVLSLEPTNEIAKKMMAVLKVQLKKHRKKQDQDEKQAKLKKGLQQTGGLLEGFSPLAIDLSVDIPVLSRRRLEVRLVESDSDSDPDVPADVPIQPRSLARQKIEAQEALIVAELDTKSTTSSSSSSSSPSKITTTTTSTENITKTTTSSSPSKYKSKSTSPLKQKSKSKTGSSLPKTPHGFESSLRALRGKNLELAHLLLKLPIKSYPKLMVTAMEADLLHRIMGALQAFTSSTNWNNNVNAIVGVLEGLLTVPRVDLAVALMGSQERKILSSLLNQCVTIDVGVLDRVQHIAEEFDVTLDLISTGLIEEVQEETHPDLD